MAPVQSNGPEALRREVLAEAHRQEGEILRRAREKADQLVGSAEREAEQMRNEKLQAARAEANRRQDSILATASVEAARRQSAHIEQLLQDIHDRARAQLWSSQPQKEREVLTELTAQALGRMTGNHFVLRLSSADFRKLGEGVVERVRRFESGRPVKLRLREDAALKDGHWLLQDEEGRQIWNLGLAARLERLWPALRRQIAAQAGFVETDQPKGETP